MPDQAEAAINIQRTWRGHHDRKVVSGKKAHRDQQRQEYFERANVLEAILVIQTRFRILLAQARRRLRELSIIRAAHLKNGHEAAIKTADVEKSATDIQRAFRGHKSRVHVKKFTAERAQKRQEYFERANMLEAVLTIQTRMRIWLARIRKNILLRNRGDMKYTLSAEQRAIAAHKAATDIQRIWHGHEARQRTKHRADERKRKMQQHVADANRLEAILVLQTRFRILLAQSRRRLREQAIIRAAHLKDVHEAAHKAADVEKSAADIQRAFRGHLGRKRVKTLSTQREKQRQDYFDRANLLEAVITIQTRVRILLAKSRRRIYERTLKHMSPARHLIDAERAATDVQRVWRGHHERNTKIAQKRREFEKKRNEYFERANMFEAVLTIQTRLRVFRARLRLKKLRLQKEGELHQKLKLEVGNGSATNSPTNAQPLVPCPPASPPSNSNSRGYTLLGGAAATTTRTAHKQTESLTTNQHSVSADHAHLRRASAPNNPHSFDEAPVTQQKMSESAKLLPMYRVPPVSRSGFFVRSFEENVASNVYQGMLNQNNNNNNNSSNEQRNGHSSGNQSKTSPNGTPFSPQQQQARKIQTRVVINEQPKSSHVLESADAIKKFVLHQQQGTKDNKIVKQTALHAMFDVVGSDKLPAIVEVWDTVTPFATSESLTVDQMVLILEQIRAIKIVSDTKRSLEKAERA